MVSAFASGVLISVQSAASLKSWLLLRAVPGLGDATYCRLIRAFGTPEAIFAASPPELTAAGASRAAAEALHRGLDQSARQAVEEELRALDRMKAAVVTFTASEYPARLTAIPDPPPILYATGTLTQDDRYAVAIVGSRKATPAGRLFTEQVSRELAALGVTVVSGLARGIDAAAHRGAVAGGGRTIAVLGCGIDRTYPPEHQALRKEIEDHGAVISELPLGAHPHGYHFPRRNRIISGMSLGVVVTEATLQSGSLITARLAADQGREVFAVPGFVKAETSRGPNGLIKQGATLIERVEDIVQELLPQFDADFQARLIARASTPSIVQRTQPDRHEARIYNLLSWDAVHIDELIERSGLTAADVASLLLSLELKGLLRQLPGHAYVRL